MRTVLNSKLYLIPFSYMYSYQAISHSRATNNILVYYSDFDKRGKGLDPD